MVIPLCIIIVIVAAAAAGQIDRGSFLVWPSLAIQASQASNPRIKHNTIDDIDGPIEAIIVVFHSKPGEWWNKRMA